MCVYAFHYRCIHQMASTPVKEETKDTKGPILPEDMKAYAGVPIMDQANHIYGSTSRFTPTEWTAISRWMLYLQREHKWVLQITGTVIHDGDSVQMLLTRTSVIPLPTITVYLPVALSDPEEEKFKREEKKLVYSYEYGDEDVVGTSIKVYRDPKQHTIIMKQSGGNSLLFKDIKHADHMTLLKRNTVTTWRDEHLIHREIVIIVTSTSNNDPPESIFVVV
jgi:hypothetical protein